VIDRSPGRRRHLPLVILLLGLATLVVGVARPHSTITVKREDATVVMALDTSRSMLAADVAPTRLQAARRVAQAFLAQVPGKFRVGIISIGTRAIVALPPTTDRALAAAAIEDLRPGEGTALGDAVLLATRVGRSERASDGSVPPTSVLLISDGASQGGTTTPAAAEKIARKAHIPITTLLVGTSNGQVERTLTGGYRELIRVPADPATLRQIAGATGGQFLTAATSTDLQEVYRRLASRLGRRSESREITDIFGGGSAALLLAGGAFSALWFRRIPVP
jgi:Ca-activated chloride channel family protein